MPTRCSEKLKVTIIDFGAVPGATREERAEEEVRRDLKKPMEQLLGISIAKLTTQQERQKRTLSAQTSVFASHASCRKGE
jgi:hypothetical protein